ncbi:response regulator transcription factor [uncultured Thiodictyon sp.]|uniref:response regulator transcription factor n=1 Tax=uncultured Thiodictyon sp. TaxID=1846217 RepID=UPI0025E97CAF|nr:response regulator transcription factor [uncultured Thiodictyon sp.]
MTSAIPTPAVRQVVVVEDDPAFLRAIGEAVVQLGDQWLVHGFRTGSEALACCHHPAARLDLVLVDLGLPDIDGIEVIRTIHGRFPAVPIMVISVVSTEARVLTAIRAGALGYILKGDSSMSMTRAIEQLMAGNYPISPKLARYLFKLAGGEPPAGAPELPQLTSKETELLKHLASGKSYGQAGEAMGVALSTVQSYIRNLYRKLDVHSQTQAVSRAREHGLLANG